MIAHYEPNTCFSTFAAPSLPATWNPSPPVTPVALLSTQCFPVGLHLCPALLNPQPRPLRCPRPQREPVALLSLPVVLHLRPAPLDHSIHLRSAASVHGGRTESPLRSYHSPSYCTSAQRRWIALFTSATHLYHPEASPSYSTRVLLVLSAPLAHFLPNAVDAALLHSTFELPGIIAQIIFRYHRPRMYWPHSIAPVDPPC